MTFVMRDVKFTRHSTFDYRLVKICLVQNHFNDKQTFSRNLIESWFFMDFHCFELPQLSLFQASESFCPSCED